MVSHLSLRLFVGACEGDCPIRGSNSDGGNNRSLQQQQQQQQQKRDEKAVHDSSESGYSADRENLSAVHPPVSSINLHSNSTCLTQHSSKCPKRRRKNEIQFTATTIKADLARAGIPFKKIDTDSIETSKVLGNVDINLKNHVQLVHSGDVSDLLVQSSNECRKTLPTDYACMINAVREFYPSNVGHNKSFKTSTIAQSKDAWSAPSTSSDVSDTENDLGNGSEKDDVIFVSPLLEDSLNSKIEDKKKAKATTTIDSRNMMLSSLSNTVTMAEILQLSKTARVVTNSAAPFSIIHANAAFHRLLGNKAIDTVIGTSFFSLIDPKSNPFEDESSLVEFMLSSSRGEGKKIYLLPSNDDDESKPMKCFIRMSPILDQKTEIQEVMTVGYFAIEFISEDNKFDENSSTKLSSCFSNKTNVPMRVVA